MVNVVVVETESTGDRIAAGVLSCLVAARQTGMDISLTLLQ